MLTDKEITMVEAIYLAIDSGNLPVSVCYQLIDKVRQKNNEQYAYLIWLLNRWRYELRSHRTHLPKRINRILSLNDFINGFST